MTTLKLLLTIVDNTSHYQLLSFTLMILFVTTVLLVLVIFLKFRLNKERKLKEQFEEKLQIQYQLFSLIAHDLRAPFVTINNQITLFNAGKLTSKSIKYNFLDIEYNFRNIINTLDNLLLWSVSQREAFSVEQTKVDIFDVTQETIDLLYPTAQLKNLKISNLIFNPTFVVTDKNHLYIILRNIIQNSIKFSLPYSEIVINSYELRGSFYLEIIDDGIGMNVNELRNIFQLKRNVSKVGTKHERGFGLGLSIVKKLVDMNNIEMSILSEPNKGTIFLLKFHSSNEL